MDWKYVKCWSLRFTAKLWNIKSNPLKEVQIIVKHKIIHLANQYATYTQLRCKIIKRWIKSNINLFEKKQIRTEYQEHVAIDHAFEKCFITWLIILCFTTQRKFLLHTIIAFNVCSLLEVLQWTPTKAVIFSRSHLIVIVLK